MELVKALAQQVLYLKAISILSILMYASAVVLVLKFAQAKQFLKVNSESHEKKQSGVPIKARFFCLVNLDEILSQTVCKIVFSCKKEEYRNSDSIYSCSSHKSILIAHALGNSTAHKHAKTYTNIPRCQQR